MNRLAALAMPLLMSACASQATAPCIEPQPCPVYKAPEDAAGVCTPPPPCASGPAPLAPVAVVPLGAEPLPPRFQPWAEGHAGDLRFVVGDQIQVTLPFYTEENALTRVAPDGNIYIALIGSVRAVDRTAAELEGELERRYGEFLRFPEVGVVPADLTNRLVFVGGEVGRPGALVLRAPTGVLEAVYEAGGFQNTARQENVILIRRGPNNLPMMKFMNLKSFANDGTPTENTLLQPFDIVVVPKSRIAQINQFVEQYIENAVPFNQSFNYVIYDVGAQ